MKKELRAEIKRSNKKKDQSQLIKVLDKNKSVVKALGIASFIALTGYSASQLLKDKKLMKKLKKGIKLPSAKKIKNILSIDGFPKFSTVRSSNGVAVKKATPARKPASKNRAAAPSKSRTTSNKKTGRKISA